MKHPFKKGVKNGGVSCLEYIYTERPRHLNFTDKSQNCLYFLKKKSNITQKPKSVASPTTKVGVQKGQKKCWSASARAPRRLNWRPGEFDQLGPTDTYQGWAGTFQNLHFPKIWVPMTFFVKTPFFDFWRAVLILKALPRQWVGKISWFFNTRLISHVKLTVPIFINKYQLVGEQWDREFRGQKSVFLR